MNKLMVFFQVEVLDIYPRKNPKTGRSFGVNIALSHGWHDRAGYKTGQTEKDPLSGVHRQIITAYEVYPEN